MNEISLIMKPSTEGNWFVKPICDFFKIDYDNQVKNIKNDRICQTGTGKKTDETVFGDKRDHLTLSTKTVLRWIQTVNPSIIDGQIRDKFIEFQSNIF